MIHRCPVTACTAAVVATCEIQSTCVCGPTDSYRTRPDQKTNQRHPVAGNTAEHSGRNTGREGSMIIRFICSAQQGGRLLLQKSTLLYGLDSRP